jgi:hypothetical protein
MNHPLNYTVCPTFTESDDSFRNLIAFEMVQPFTPAVNNISHPKKRRKSKKKFLKLSQDGIYKFAILNNASRLTKVSTFYFI